MKNSLGLNIFIYFLQEISIYQKALQKEFSTLLDNMNIEIIHDIYSKGILSLRHYQQIRQREEREGTIVALEFMLQVYLICLLNHIFIQCVLFL